MSKPKNSSRSVKYKLPKKPRKETQPILKSPKLSHKQLKQIVPSSAFYFLKFSGSAIAVVATVSTILAFWISAWPFVSIEPNQETSTDYFEETKFIITNESPLPIYNVTYIPECWDGDMPTDAKVKIKFASPALFVQGYLPAHASFSASLFKIPNLNQDSVNFYESIHAINRPILQIYVTFIPKFLFWKTFQVGRRFWAYRQHDGKYIWNPDGPAERFKATDNWPRLNP